MHSSDVISRRGRLFRTAPGVLAALLALGTSGQAERPRIYAISNVRVVTAPGRMIEQATVVLRDGLIEAVGASVTIPADAQIIEAEEGWTVYPAFIDAATTIGQPPAEPARMPENFQDAIAMLSQQSEPQAGAGHELGAVHPERAVVDELNASDDRISAHRKLGFAMAHSLPMDGLIKGQSALIALRSGSSNELVVRDRVAQTMGLDTVGFMIGGYPSSKIGAMAGIRQALLDARRSATWRQRFDENPAGMSRPEFRSSDAALLAVLEQQQPTLFVANATLDYGRFRRLSDEFGLASMAMALGCHERPERLAAGKMPVLLPLEFPKKPKTDDEDELRQTDVDAMQQYLRAPRLPGILSAQGLEFALVTGKMSSTRDFHRNLKKAIDNGLSESDALAALTTVPARLLGVSESVGTVEAGKVANLIVVDGELFTDKPEFRFVFVDGIHEEFEAEAQKGDPNAVVDPRGVWEITTEVMGRDQTSTWTIEGSERAYTGFSESERAGRRDFESVDLEGDALTIVSAGPMGSLEVTAIISGDTLEGETSIDTPRGSISIKVSGKRVSGPEGGRR